MKFLDKGYNGESGVYVAVLPTQESKTQILNMIKDLNPPFPLKSFDDEAHMTVVYSRNEHIDSSKIIIPEEIIALSIKFEYWDGHDKDGYLVLKMISEPAQKLHDHILMLGAEHSFKEYSPHMTIIHGISEYKSNIIKWINEINKKFISKIIIFNTMTIDNCKR